MEEVLNALDQLDYVKRYSWFDPNSNNPKYPSLETVDLITEANELTALGNFYASHSLSASNFNLPNIYIPKSSLRNNLYKWKH